LAIANSLQSYSQASTGATVSLSYPIKRSFKRVGITYGFDVSSISTFTTASQLYFEDVTFRNISGPNALSGIRTSKVTPNFTYNHIDYPSRPHNGKSFFVGTDISGLGGNVRAVRPVAEYKQFIPMKGLIPKYGHPTEGRQTLGFRIQASHISGYGGLGASPFERFFLGGDTDLRGFDIRAVSPVAFLASSQSISLQNPDGSTVPLDPNNPRRGNTIVQVPMYQVVFPGGDTSLISNLEYRIPIVGPVTMAAFVDTGWNMILQPSQLKLSSSILNDPTTGLNNLTYGCAAVTPAYACQGKTLTQLGFPQVGGDLRPISGTNGIMRMSTGLELQVILPVVNAPFRIYYAVNPMRMNTIAMPPETTITRSMFPPGGAGDFTYQQAIATYGTGYRLHEPFNTFRFTVATTF
jgi:outer membrane protein insertion porin family